MNFNIKGAIQSSFFIFICVGARLGNKKDREIDMKKIDLQGAILAGVAALIIGMTGWLMSTTL